MPEHFLPVLFFLVNSQGAGNSTSQEICGSPLTTIENSETVAMVVGLAIMFILVIYSRSVIFLRTLFSLI